MGCFSPGRLFFPFLPPKGGRETEKINQHGRGRKIHVRDLPGSLPGSPGSAVAEVMPIDALRAARFAGRHGDAAEP